MNRSTVLILTSLLALPSCAAKTPAPGNLTTAETDVGRMEGWPAEVRDIRYRSSIDDSMQPALFYAPPAGKARPVLVALHTWSSNYLQKTGVDYARWCIDKGWVFIHPNFRGPNRGPQATGSEMVVADILSALAHAKQQAAVDDSRVYLVGGSGGGMASLLMAGRAPQVWTAVSAWVPILDLQTWYFESVRMKQRYAGEIVASVGGIPDEGTAAAAEAKRRSPGTYLAAARGLRLAISAGIHDGHGKASVPISHSIRAFNLLADEKDRLTEEQIAWFTDTQTVPPALVGEAAQDPTYGDKKVLFRRQSGQVTLTIFAGGHELISGAALPWLEAQNAER
jgi:dienelactone hydrolase